MMVVVLVCEVVMVLVLVVLVLVLVMVVAVVSTEEYNFAAFAVVVLLVVHGCCCVCLLRFGLIACTWFFAVGAYVICRCRCRFRCWLGHDVFRVHEPDGNLTVEFHTEYGWRDGAES